MREYTFDEEVLLIAATEPVDDIGDVAPEETKRRSYAEVLSVFESETYKALAVGLEPELKIILPSWYDDYHGERLLEYNGVRYNVIRSYRNPEDLTAELTVTKG